MMRLLIPIILFIVSAVSFFLFTNPLYLEIKQLRTDTASYSEALQNANQLRKVRDDLNTRYKSFTPVDIDRLQKMVPNTVDNIRLILEINSIANKYSMVLKNIKYDTETKQTTDPRFAEVPQQGPKKQYQTFEMAFSTEGSYDNFLLFLRDLEKNLRIVDISSITFSAPDANPGQQGQTNANVYRYDFKVKTYWLKQ